MQLIKYKESQWNISRALEHLIPLEEKLKAADKTEEIEAAIKGMVMLKETYNLDIEAMVKRSHMETGLNNHDLYLMAKKVCEKLFCILRINILHLVTILGHRYELVRHINKLPASRKIFKTHRG